MSAIAATNSSAYSAAASLLNSATTSAAEAPPKSGEAPSPDSATSSGNPTDTVDLSDRAKQILARAKSEQLAADKLSVLLQSIKNPDGKGIASKAGTSDQTTLFDQLSGSQTSSKSSTTQWEAGSKYGDPTISDSDFLEKVKPALLASAEGLPPEQRQALEAAINNGTIQFQKASDIAGLNYHSTVTYTGSPGGLEGMTVTHQSNPTGAAKDALDQGRAFTLWAPDRGDVYVSW
jgi:hypothetical protein